MLRISLSFSACNSLSLSAASLSTLHPCTLQLCSYPHPRQFRVPVFTAILRRALMISWVFIVIPPSLLPALFNHSHFAFSASCPKMLVVPIFTELNRSPANRADKLSFFLSLCAFEQSFQKEYNLFHFRIPSQFFQNGPSWYPNISCFRNFLSLTLVSSIGQFFSSATF